ncbi:UDP-glucosyltransferase 29-like [Rhodamnia argentea]|uniref:Glycosyltransferase n=1 Tax=Rhodamnia argentea TaxID=178133 RepID=A0ABM3HU90_9MYRT|nr:UDP-glucosyltransferase 29-like [Rhodamnia argentea]
MSPERGAFTSILMLPWLAHGHISPFLELSKRFADRNIHIYFCSTPVNLASVKPKLAGTKYFSKIKLVELHLPSLPELPPRNHTTKTLPPHLMPTLKKAFDTSSPGFAGILRLLVSDLVVYDFLQPWAPAIGTSLGIPAVEFLCTSATMCAFVNHANMKPGVEFPYPGIYLHDHEFDKFTNLLECSANGIKDRERVFQCFERSLDMIIIKGIREIEGKYIDYLSFLLDKRVVPVGPLVEDTMFEDGEKSKILDWLDNREEKSTVFVSFGSEYFLSKQEMTEIAHGLEASKVNFVWVVRFHDGERDAEANSRCHLPEGFLKRVAGRGLVLQGWAPQAAILQHSSIGGFVSHCGWSSVMESIRFGVPIIAMPMHLDQPMNARVAEEVGVGTEVKRDETEHPESGGGEEHQECDGRQGGGESEAESEGDERYHKKERR